MLIARGIQTKRRAQTNLPKDETVAITNGDIYEQGTKHYKQEEFSLVVNRFLVLFKDGSR